MGSFYMEATQINYRRDETVKTVDQKLQELSQESAIDTDIAPVFKSTITYAPGDMVYYRNKLYVFNVAHSGAWAAGDVTATNVTTAIKNAAAVKADEADIAPAFDAAASYAAGDLVYYGGIIYRCTNDHSGDWDADDFSETTITGELGSLMSGILHHDFSYADLEGAITSLLIYVRDNLSGVGGRTYIFDGTLTITDTSSTLEYNAVITKKSTHIYGMASIGNNIYNINYYVGVSKAIYEFTGTNIVQ